MRRSSYNLIVFFANVIISITAGKWKEYIRLRLAIRVELLSLKYDKTEENLRNQIKKNTAFFFVKWQFMKFLLFFVVL